MVYNHIAKIPSEDSKTGFQFVLEVTVISSILQGESFTLLIMFKRKMHTVCIADIRV